MLFLENFRFETDASGLALITWDMSERSMNVITQNVMIELGQIIDKVSEDPGIKGAIITSGKDTFSGGADLTMLQAVGVEYGRRLRTEGEDKAARFFFNATAGLSKLYRRLETCGKPFVAAIHGTCLGGAFELALACHHRVVSDSDKTRLGLPEVKVGLFPGAGGTQRVSRLMPTGDALQMLFKGEQLKPQAALKMNLVHAVVPREQLLETARQWILNGGSAVQPWDQEKFKLPSGKVHSPGGMMIWPPANAIYRRETFDNYPAAKAILQAVYEGLQLPMDRALNVESGYFAYILRTPQAAAMIRSLFISKGELDKGARRPKSVPPGKITRVGIVGAGFMGAGIAYVSAQAGLEVVLVDRDQASADKGKAHSDKLISGQIDKGRAKPADREALLARITATPDYTALKGCDLVIEAVFEDRAIKAEVIRKVEAAIGPETVFASNTSTLPITSLAENFTDAPRFIGVHFFSPVDKMLLVEVIMGKKTGDIALARALDFVRAIKKTPIVVNDSRGFYANRAVLNYIREGHLMLAEGIPPAMIENLAKKAGMPVGPLSLNDEVALDLGWKILQATKKDLGEKAIDPRQEALLKTMVVDLDRLGRKNGKGFYDYAPEGKTLWPGLKDLQTTKLDADSLDKQEIIDRLLVTQALEAARTVEEGVITDVREADVGAILGFGFAPFTGGPISYIDAMGAKAFVALCDKLAKKHGARFKPNALLKDMAAKGTAFYSGMGAAKTAA